MDRSAVYRVHRKTYRVFKNLTRGWGSLGTYADPRYFFRVVPSRRCSHSLELRKKVADAVRYERQVSRLEAQGMTTSDAQKE